MEHLFCTKLHKKYKWGVRAPFIFLFLITFASVKNDVQIEQFGKRLRQLRKDAGLTQEMLAYAAGIDRKTLRKIEKGQAVVLLDTIISLSRAIKKDPATFFKGMEIDYEK